MPNDIAAKTKDSLSNATNDLSTMSTNLETSIDAFDTTIQCVPQQLLGSETFSSLTSNVSEVKSLLHTLNENISNLPSNVTNAADVSLAQVTKDLAKSDAITKVAADVSKITSDVSKLQTAVAALKTTLDTLPTEATDVSELKTVVASLQTTVNTLPTEVTDVSKLETAVDAVKTKLDTLPTKVTDVSKLETAVTTLQTAVDALPIDVTDVSKLKTAITSLQTTVKTLPTEITDISKLATAVISLQMTVKELPTEVTTAANTSFGAATGGLAKSETIATITSNVSKLEERLKEVKSVLNTLPTEVTTAASTSLANATKDLAKSDTLTTIVGNVSKLEGSVNELKSIMETLPTRVTETASTSLSEKDLATNAELEKVAKAVNDIITTQSTIQGAVESLPGSVDAKIKDQLKDTLGLVSAALDCKPGDSRANIRAIMNDTVEKIESITSFLGAEGDDPDSSILGERLTALKERMVDKAELKQNLNDVINSIGRLQTSSNKLDGLAEGVNVKVGVIDQVAKAVVAIMESRGPVATVEEEPFTEEARDERARSLGMQMLYSNRPSRSATPLPRPGTASSFGHSAIGQKSKALKSPKSAMLRKKPLTIDVRAGTGSPSQISPTAPPDDSIAARLETPVPQEVELVDAMPLYVDIEARYKDIFEKFNNEFPILPEQVPAWQQVLVSIDQLIDDFDILATQHWPNESVYQLMQGTGLLQAIEGETREEFAVRLQETLGVMFGDLEYITTSIQACMTNCERFQDVYERLQRDRARSKIIRRRVACSHAFAVALVTRYGRLRIWNWARRHIGIVGANESF